MVRRDRPAGSKLERPLFQEALRLCEKGSADGIAVYRLDRFARQAAWKRSGKDIERVQIVMCGNDLLVPREEGGPAKAENFNAGGRETAGSQRRS